jgi:hypothetical protein
MEIIDSEKLADEHPLVFFANRGDISYLPS